MAAVPDTAVERLRRLEAKVENQRAAAFDAQEAFLHARNESGRLETALQSAGRGARIEVDAEGLPFFREQRRAGIEQSGGGQVDHFRSVPRYLDDPGARQTAADVARLRRAAAAAVARRDALHEKLNPLTELASACRRALEARGWHEGPNLTMAAASPAVRPVVRGAA